MRRMNGCYSSRVPVKDVLTACINTKLRDSFFCFVSRNVVVSTAVDVRIFIFSCFVFSWRSARLFWNMWRQHLGWQENCQRLVPSSAFFFSRCGTASSSTGASLPSSPSNQLHQITRWTVLLCRVVLFFLLSAVGQRSAACLVVSQLAAPSRITCQLSSLFFLNYYSLVCV